MPYRYEEHTADLKITATGNDFPGVVNSVIDGIKEFLFETTDIKHTESYPISIKADDLVELIVSLLEEILFLHETELFIFDKLEFKEIQIEKPPYTIKAVIIGQKKSADMIIKTEIKAVTYAEAEIYKKKDDTWYISLVFDI